MLPRAAALLLVLGCACTEPLRTPAPAATSDITATPVPAAEIGAASRTAPSGWAGKWKRRAQPSMVGNLEIRDVTANGFHFDVSLMTGAHQGGLEGDAVFTPEGARFEWPAERPSQNECTVNFIRRDGALVLTQENDCSLTMGFGVSANGAYHPEAEVQTYPTTFDCAGATSAVDRAVCAHEALADADLHLGARDSARIRKDISCSDDVAIERCVAGAYLRRFRALRGSTGRGLDLAGMRRAVETRPVIGLVSARVQERRFRTPARAWHELELYLLEQLPRERYEELVSHRLEDEHVAADATGIALTSCLPFCCECMASYVRVDARGGVWAVLDGSDAVVLTPRAPEPEPAPMRAWLVERKIEKTPRVRAFE